MMRTVRSTKIIKRSMLHLAGRPCTVWIPGSLAAAQARKNGKYQHRGKAEAKGNNHRISQIWGNGQEGNDDCCQAGRSEDERAEVFFGDLMGHGDGEQKAQAGSCDPSKAIE
ncbi:MAG: hypothetical protein U5L00_21175 [Desulfovermiculus sp.]|nr:hypothetical protein [Desulfovermiculus sp.]